MSTENGNSSHEPVRAYLIEVDPIIMLAYDAADAREWAVDAVRAAISAWTVEIHVSGEVSPDQIPGYEPVFLSESVKADGLAEDAEDAEGYISGADARAIIERNQSEG